MMNDMQLTMWAKIIAGAMKSGDMEKVSEIYSKISENATMENAARLEEIIATLL